MNRFRKFLPVVLGVFVVAAILGVPSHARASFQLIIRATEYNKSGVAVASVQSATSTSGTSPITANLNFNLLDFTFSSVNTIADTDLGTTSHSTPINLHYTGLTGANAHQLLIEVLGSNYVSPASGLAFITTTGAVSTSGLAIPNVTLTSGVIASDPTAFNSVTNGVTTLATTPLGGQLGVTTVTGTMGSASSVLNPNPAVSPNFTLTSPFAFYQTYTFSGFTTKNRSGNLGSGSEVVDPVAAVPAPASYLLIVTSLPLFIGCGWFRRRKPCVQTA